MKDWDYSILTHTANLHGGPEKYIDKIKINASQNAIKMTNKKWLKSITPLFLVMTPFAIKGALDIGRENIPKIKQHLSKKTVTDKEAKEAKEKLIEYYHDSSK